MLLSPESAAGMAAYLIILYLVVDLWHHRRMWQSKLLPYFVGVSPMPPLKCGCRGCCPASISCINR
ncbi:hypothetical protein PIB30_045987, partial [Stylosanthes scabra]|nr:hypothetical protein [Stylosanthes scabra]